MEQSYVILKDVRKTYHMGEVSINAADGVNFEIKKGEFVVIVGPSGAGKTTILNILGGMDTVTSGEVIVDGVHIESFKNRQLTKYRREDIGFIFQFYNLVPNLTAKENVELALQICKNPRDAETVLKEVGLGERLNNFPSQLSGGEQQRDTCRKQKMTVLVITHNSAIAPMADRVIRIKNGKAASVRTNPSPVSVEDIEW